VPASVSRKAPANCYGKYAEAGETPGIGGHDPNLGRWPANLIHDGSEEAVGLFPEDGDASAARFFYCAKADASERRNSKHPTIKPVALMRYLVRLVTPPGGLVLDPFGGSGTTAEAARLEHCRFLLMELNPEYCADAAERLRQGVLW
jgi:site-specific DNA-methyltransferase (adenine-specific)